MKKINRLFVLLTVLAAWTGCNDEAFLTEKPETFYTVDNAFSTSEQVDQIVVACYSQIRTMFCMAEENNTAFVFRGGSGTDMYDVSIVRRGNRFNDYGILNPSAAEFYNNYSHWYQLISKANLALYAAELPQITWASTADKTYATAQARFFRAFCYRNLGELYGGVPVVTEIATSPRYDFERTTRVETYQFAIDELEAILNDLPETTATPGRLVRGAAQHNLALLYIDRGVALEEEGKASEAQTAFDKSISYASQLIDGGLYSLMTERFGSRKDENPEFYYAATVAEQTPDRLYSAVGYPLEGNVYWDLFQEGNQNYQEDNREAIWVAQIDYAAYRTEDKQSFLPYTREFGMAMRDVISEHIQGMLEDQGGRGILCVIPTFYTRDIIYEGKWGDDLRNSESVHRRIILGNVATSPYFGKPIPWSVLYRDGENQEAVNTAETYGYPISCKIATDKYTGLADGEIRSNLFRDEYLIRLPETILLRAEAKWRRGDNAGAAADVNLLRARSKCGYMVQASDVNLDLILDERARELVYEETRWNTLLRMGGTVAVDRIKKYAYWDDPRATLTKNFNLWPIPQAVIDTNKDIPMQQNPGW
ncbi:MAG: RagB/SusD family nutrient uptake outer membrane protein [Tannerella sp.]|jgi:tetratricopeptide (TPR) repeat protein|nr:RagB/SusD family nutrient uptake outer membrane protein [Tannerella sp.]